MNKNVKFEAKHEQDKYIIIGTIAALVILGGLMVWLSSFSPKVPARGGLNATTTPLGSGATSTANTASSTIPVDKIDRLAKFLTAQGIKMYGAAWCTHCQDQKKAFGTAFQYVTYVECPENTKLCLAEGVQGYPTWKKPSGEKIEGFVPLDKLAAWAGFKY